MISESLLEIRDYAGEGYRPLIDFGAWRVAILRYIDELLPQNIGRLQRHDETDEVFVLLSGRCLLFIAEGADQADRDDRVGEIHPQDMQPFKLYNIKRGTWHTHTLSEDATVLIVENRDTGSGNSPEIELEAAQRACLVHLTQQTWNSK
jgi:ureidoglycolate hydrolase